MSLEEVEAFLDQEGAGALRRQRQPGGRGARPEPQRALSAAAALRTVSAAPPAPARRISARHRGVLLLAAARPALPAVVVALAPAVDRRLHPEGPVDARHVRSSAAGGASRLALRQRVVCPLQTLSNLLAACARATSRCARAAPTPDDALGEVMLEVNALAETLREQRLGALEATALLRKVMEEIDVAVFTFDGGAAPPPGEPRRRAAARAAGRAAARDAPPAELGLAELPRRRRRRASWTMAFPGGVGRWEVRRGDFRQGGLPHQLLVLTDVSRTLREEERQAWQRLMRVLGHEINNSLAPIKSIAGSLASLLRREARPARLARGRRARARGDRGAGRGADPLHRRVRAAGAPAAAAARAARRRAARSARRRPRDAAAGRASIAGSAAAHRRATPISSSSCSSTSCATRWTRRSKRAGGVRVGWAAASAARRDLGGGRGPGLAQTANLFVPFFTTKPGGSGIGLVLSRQIAEAHGGTLTLENRVGRPPAAAPCSACRSSRGPS